MLLAGALSALFMAGFWLYCLTDAILTPASECRGLPKTGAGGLASADSAGTAGPSGSPAWAELNKLKF